MNKLFETITASFVLALFSSIFSAIVILIISGEPWGYTGFWINTILFTVVFIVVNLIKDRKSKK
jgi:hypothetical protein